MSQPSTKRLKAALQRYIHQSKEVDDEELIVACSKIDRFWALILCWYPELRPSGCSDVYGLHHENENVWSLRKLIWPCRLQQNPLGGTTEASKPKLLGYFQRLWRRGHSCAATYDFTKDGYLAGLKAWGAIDRAIDSRTGILDFPVKTISAIHPVREPQQTLRWSMLKDIEYVLARRHAYRLSKTLSSWEDEDLVNRYTTGSASVDAALRLIGAAFYANNTSTDMQEVKRLQATIKKQIDDDEVEARRLQKEEDDKGRHLREISYDGKSTFRGTKRVFADDGPQSLHKRRNGKIDGWFGPAQK